MFIHYYLLINVPAIYQDSKGALMTYIQTGCMKVKEIFKELLKEKRLTALKRLFFLWGRRGFVFIKKILLSKIDIEEILLSGLSSALLCWKPLRKLKKKYFWQANIDIFDIWYFYAWNKNLVLVEHHSISKVERFI